MPSQRWGFEVTLDRRESKMNKKFLISWVVVFVAWMVGSFVVHGVLLHDGYTALANLFRTEEDANKY